MTPNLVPIAAHTTEGIRALHAALFPVSYSDAFYTRLLSSPSPQLNRVLVLGDRTVGAVTCRIEQDAVVIMTLGVGKGVRRQGLGSLLLRHVEREVEKLGVSEIRLHVQENNERALAFYAKHGYCVREYLENYYKRIEPRGCYLLSKFIAQ